MSRITNPSFLALTSQVEANALETLEIGRKYKADDTKCVGSCGIAARLVVENGEFTLADTTTSQSLGVLVHKDLKKGSASTNSPADIEQSVRDAVAIATFSVPDPNLTMADSKMAGPAKELPFLVDDRVTEVEMGELGELMQEVMIEFQKEPKLAIDRFELGSSVSFHTMVNSRGVRQKEFQTKIAWSYLGLARDGQEVSGMDYQGGFGYSWDHARTHIKDGVREFIDRVVGLLNPTKCPSYKGPILIAPRAVSELLLGTILYHASGRSVMDGKSRWGSSVGTRVVSPKLTLIDNPHDKALGGATAYDSDGLPTMPQTLIREGVLACHLFDCYSAKKLGTRSNAMAGGPFCLELKSGNESLANLFHARDEILVVQRFSGNVDSLTGDFSGLAKSSRLVRQGKDVGAVRETMIAGNIFELAENILGVSSELTTVSGSYKAPTILVDGITVS